MHAPLDRGVEQLEVTTSEIGNRRKGRDSQSRDRPHRATSRSGLSESRRGLFRELPNRFGEPADSGEYELYALHPICPPYAGVPGDTALGPVARSKKSGVHNEREANEVANRLSPRWWRPIPVHDGR